MDIDRINQNRCRDFLIKRDQKFPKVVDADHDFAQPAMTFITPSFKDRGTVIGGQVFVGSFGMGCPDKAVNAIEVLTHPFSPAFHRKVRRAVSGERILLRSDAVHDVFDGIRDVMLVWCKVPWKLSVKLSAPGAFEAAHNAVVGMAAFSTADPEATVTILQERAAARAVMVLILAFNRENAVLRIEDDSLL